MNYILLLLFVAAVQGSLNKRFKRLIRIDKNNDTAVQDEGTHCFHYTWLANDDVESFAPWINKTCSEKFSKDKPNLRLCVDPMAVTKNGHAPDHALLSQYHPDAKCKLQGGETCVKYTYRFNGKVQNITRYCSKVVVNDMPMESGCVASDSGSYETEVCACKNNNGLPCNGSSQIRFMSAGLLFWILNLLFT